MRARRKFLGGVYLDNPHIMLASLLAFAVFAFHDSWQVAYASIFVLLAFGLFLQPVVRVLSFLARCAAPLLLGVLVVIVYFTLHAQPEKLQFEDLGIDNATIQWALDSAKFNDKYKEVFYQAISTLYAIIVGLALVKGIEDVGEAKKTLSQEVYVVRAMWSYLKYFEPEENSRATTQAKRDIRKCLLQYTENVGARRDTRSEPGNQEILDSCRTRILELEPYDRDDKIAQQEVIREFERLGVLRAQRIGNIGGKISRFLLAALWMMSLALILPFLAEPLCVSNTEAASPVAAGYGSLINNNVALGVSAAETAAATQNVCGDAGKHLQEDRFSQYYMIFIMVAFFSFLMLMLHDISTPDNGFWKVDLKPFRDLYQELEPDQRALLEHEDAVLASAPPEAQAKARARSRFVVLTRGE